MPDLVALVAIASLRRGDQLVQIVVEHPLLQYDCIHPAAHQLVHLSLLGTRWGVGQRNLQPHALVDEALAAVDATGFADERMSQVSGGQQQRVAIAAGLVNSPDLLLLDEPLANLDMRNQRQIAALLGRLATERNMTVFVVAHQLNSLLEVLTSAVYLLDEHAHYDVIGKVVDEELLSHLYGTSIAVVRTPQGDLFTRNA